MALADRSRMEPFLKRLLLRSELGPEEREAILGLDGHRQEVGAHRDFISPGITADYSCLLLEGLAARFDQMRDGRRQITALYIPGDMCDLQSTVWPTAAWGMTALSPSVLLRVSHSQVAAVAGRYPAIMAAFWRDTTADAATLAKWVGNIGRKDARARVAHLFCEMGIRMEKAGLATRTAYPLRATQEQLGDMTGLTPVHVNRTLQALRAEEAVSFKSSRVEVADWNLLASIAEFDPRFLMLDDRELKQAG